MLRQSSDYRGIEKIDGTPAVMIGLVLVAIRERGATNPWHKTTGGRAPADFDGAREGINQRTVDAIVTRTPTFGLRGSAPPMIRTAGYGWKGFIHRRRLA